MRLVSFSKIPPVKHFILREMIEQGGKRSKERITVLLCASSAGEKFKPLVIGKSKQPVSDKLMWTDGQSSDYMLSLRGALKQQANMSVFNSNREARPVRPCQGLQLRNRGMMHPFSPPTTSVRPCQGLQLRNRGMMHPFSPPTTSHTAWPIKH